MKKQWKLLLICLLLPLAAGGVSAYLSGGGMRLFSAMKHPPLSPPGWVFPVVWTILYLAMGIASYLVLVSESSGMQIRSAMTVYGLQLAVNFFWPILFFRFSLYPAAFCWLVFLWGLIVLTMVRFYRVRERAGDLLVPYLLWVTFAGYLNAGVWMLN